MTLLASHIMQRLHQLADETVAQQTRKFFKTADSQYSANDIFIGIRIPVLRREIKAWRELSLAENVHLLQAPQHEIRMCGLLLLVDQFQRGDASTQAAIYQHYLQQLSQINNWDLVDGSAPYIVGAWLLDKDKACLYQLAQSADLWQRRIAIVATLHFIRQHQFQDTLALAEILLNDQHDLIHKAVGWMLREVGKRDLVTEQNFLEQHHRQMPRTMLRYAIERLPLELRQRYMAR